jgi:protein ImuB
MRIPSYDDLTPAIPDISPGEVFTGVNRLLPGSGPVAMRCAGEWVQPAGLFAALHGRDGAALMAIAREFSPRIARRGPSDVVLDVGGLERLLGDARAIGSELVRAGAPAVGIAPTAIAARLLARACPGLSVAPAARPSRESSSGAGRASGGGAPRALINADLERALGGIPLIVLQRLVADDTAAGDRSTAPVSPPKSRSTSPGDAVFDVLRRWGLTTLGELAALPAADLSARLGRTGVALQRLARGIDAAPLVPDPSVPRFVETLELEWPIDALEPLSFVLARLLEPLAVALERADRGAAAIRLDLRLTDRSTHARLLQLPAAMRDPRVLRTLLLLDLESHPPSSAIDIVSIEVDPAPARVIQYSLLERALPSAETLATLNARLGALVGDARCGSPVLLDTHRPDAFEMTRFGPADSPNLWRAALLQDAALCLRRFRPPIAIRVTVEQGRPVHVAIDRRGMPGGRVTDAAGPWRSSGAWWDADRWNRDEWDAAFADGSICRVFRDRDTGMWFMDGVFD